MVANTFQELIVWQKSKEIILVLYPISKTISEFSYRDQLNRALLSISNNIAEGFGRNSNKEFKRFLNISLGSSYEVHSMLIIFKELKILPFEISQALILKIEEIIRLLVSLITKIKI